MPQHKGGKKGRKIGKNKDKCKRYQANRKKEKNKKRKLIKHIKKYPKDQVAKISLEKLNGS